MVSKLANPEAVSFFFMKQSYLHNGEVLDATMYKVTTAQLPSFQRGRKA